MRARLALVFSALAVPAVAIVAIVAIVGGGQRAWAPPLAYSPQADRIATWDAPPFDIPIGASQVPYLASRGSMTFLNPATGGFTIGQHFATTRKLVAAAGARKLRVFDYVNVSYWYQTNYSGWAPYSAGFNNDWLLRDASGRPIAFDRNPLARATNQPRAQMLDLSNPALRQWIVNTVVSWMRTAPYAGVFFDSADVLLGNVARGSVADGRTSFDALLCGSPAPDCARVASWNAGLAALLASATAALRVVGDQTIYNGIAPSAQRGPSRNLALLSQADGAVNESFCYVQQPGYSSDSSYQPLAPDAAIMRASAVQHKLVVEITNYERNTSTQLAGYCAAGFLMGWQPGSSLQIYHRTYADLDDVEPVTVPEMDLNLGKPTTSGFQQTGGVLSRTFDNGFVGVNSGPTAATVIVPFAAQRFAGGRSAGHVKAGMPVAIGGHSGVFFLRDSFLVPAPFGGD